MPNPRDYSLYLKFVDRFLPGGFLNISQNDPMVIEATKLAQANNQFFYMADVIRLQFLYVNPRSVDVIGMEPEKVDPAVILSLTHPDDIRRHQLARLKLISIGMELLRQREGYGIISTNVRARKMEGDPMNLLYQGYLFYSSIPSETVYMLMVLTDISWSRKSPRRFHYYAGNDLSAFRFPDRQLLETGNIYTPTELRILQHIEAGLNSEQIAKHFYRSVHTIDTHRSNIIKKSGMTSIWDVIIDLKNKGLM